MTVSATVRATGAALSLLLAACLGPSDESGDEPLRISGRVVGSGSMPVAGIEVRSLRTGACDTTDLAGGYALDVTGAASTARRPDTLVFTRNRQLLARVGVAPGSGPQPDTRVIQRDVSGFLAVGARPVARIELVLRGDGIDSSSPMRTSAYYNELAGNYSGYAFFPPPEDVMNFVVQVLVYGPDDELLGMGPPVPFNSYAGDITIPAFSVEPEPDR